MKKTIKEYQKEIQKATTKEELQAISYAALRNDPECTVFSKKYDRIISMCTQREAELEAQASAPAPSAESEKEQPQISSDNGTAQVLDNLTKAWRAMHEAYLGISHINEGSRGADQPPIVFTAESSHQLYAAIEDLSSVFIKLRTAAHADIAAEIASIRNKPFMERTGAEQEQLHSYWFEHNIAKETPLNVFMGMSWNQYGSWKRGDLLLNDGSFHEMEPSYFQVSEKAVEIARRMMNSTGLGLYWNRREQFMKSIPAGKECHFDVDLYAMNNSRSADEIASSQDYLTVFDPSDELVAVIGPKDVLHKEDFAALLKASGIKPTETNFNKVWMRFPDLIDTTLLDAAKDAVHTVFGEIQKNNKVSLDGQIHSAQARSQAGSAPAEKEQTTQR